MVTSAFFENRVKKAYAQLAADILVIPGRIYSQVFIFQYVSNRSIHQLASVEDG